MASNAYHQSGQPCDTLTLWERLRLLMTAPARAEWWRIEPLLELITLEDNKPIRMHGQRG